MAHRLAFSMKHIPRKRFGQNFLTDDGIIDGIVRAIDTRRDVVYLPGFWWPIMWIIRHLPESYFKKLKL